jgi:hypothetical protein
MIIIVVVVVLVVEVVVVVVIVMLWPHWLSGTPRGSTEALRQSFIHPGPRHEFQPTSPRDCFPLHHLFRRPVDCRAAVDGDILKSNRTHKPSTSHFTDWTTQTHWQYRHYNNIIITFIKSYGTERLGLLRIREVPDSNFGWKTERPDRGFSWFYSVPPNKHRTSTLN